MVDLKQDFSLFIAENDLSAVEVVIAMVRYILSRFSTSDIIFLNNGLSWKIIPGSGN